MESAPLALNLALWVLLAAVALLSGTLGIALAYHWFRYATDLKTPIVASAVYAIVSFVLLVVLLALALSV